mmetsp:Transcript_23131/g.34292  ORF Transcript_23131/g.34292 Transcript_23131/m.34292 type:complete len:84 (-) Transcript_23131:368-619(-)
MKYCNLLRLLIGYEVFCAGLCKPSKLTRSSRRIIESSTCSSPLDKSSTDSGDSKYEQWVSSLSSPYQNVLYLPTSSSFRNGMA